ncbi:MAG: peptidase, partial [Frankiales bacterium]|nr:peptidase [Frankiales bacterium]
TYGKDLDLLDRSADAQRKAQAVAQQRARVVAAERASRSRRLAVDAQAKAKAAAATKAAALRTLYVRPADGPLTSPFGHRWGRLHAGLDFGAPFGSPIRAVMAGTIIDAGYSTGGYGNFVHVQHADGTVTSYNHMSKILRRGGTVQAGDVLGLIGSTGHSTGPHLHFEVRINDVPIDPAPWLRARGIF